VRYASFRVDGRSTFGAAVGHGLIDLGCSLGPEVLTLRRLLELGLGDAAERLARSRAADYDQGDVQFDPVIPAPGKIICVGVNYAEHAAEAGRTPGKYPMLFARYAESQTGHESPIVVPVESAQLDFEGELAVTIGRRGRRIGRERALEHVAGYSCYNDASVRDWQAHTSQFLPGKNFPFTGAFGPWLTTPDEVDGPDGLLLETRLNDQVMQRASTDQMLVDVADLIAYCSTILELLPDDVIVTGTPGGVGVRRDPPVWMAPGDTVEVEISGVGKLVNTVVAETTGDPAAT
jgi:2-keto-4-pentenoate hydratase/2-oxohepta-3-ene-1,7-dioic acid hydratase in catechol pathway